MKKMLGTLSDQRGFAIFGAILVLALVTIIGIAAISTSTSERRTATNFMLYERVFYTAEAGLEHVKERFKDTLLKQKKAAGTTVKPRFSFALAGATATNYAGGASFISNQRIDTNTYTITVWDNDDSGGDPADDSDGMIWIRSVATGPQHSSCSIETLVEATAEEGKFHGYNAQEGGGSGKNYTSNDAKGINFSAQGFAQSRRVGVGG